MKPVLNLSATLILSLVLILSTTSLSVHAQSPVGSQTGQKSGVPYPGGPHPTRNPSIPVTTEQAPHGISSTQTTGGPDDYGYTWDDTAAYAWKDASNGNTLNLSNECDIQTVPLGFTFKYYENTYTSIQVFQSGFATFNTGNNYCGGNTTIPSPGSPNNVIAPYWIWFNSGTIRYLQGGTAPNRYLVIEWDSMIDQADSNSRYTFETVLSENGDIVFQYQTIKRGQPWYEPAIGIEDSSGSDGLGYKDYYSLPNKAILFSRPAAAYRVKINTLRQGRFTTAGSDEIFQITLTNTGEMGPDTYDLDVASTWPLAIFQTNGSPWTDTNGNGKPDTGPLAQGSNLTLIAKIQTPFVVNIGDANTASMTVTSAGNPEKTKIFVLETAISAPFTQVYTDESDGAMRIDMNQPSALIRSKVSANNYYGIDHSVVEAPNGNLVYAWSKERCINQCKTYLEEIEYTIVSHAGQSLKGITKLADNSGSSYSVYDYLTAIAITPDGKIGITWIRELYDRTGGKLNDNIYFAILDSSGNLINGPSNLTNITSWIGSGSGYIDIYDPQIGQTSDNHFVVGWDKEDYNGNTHLYNEWFAVVTSSGSILQAPKALTSDGNSRDLRLNPVTGGVLATWTSNQNNMTDLYYSVIDSGGDLEKGITNLSQNGQAASSNDAVSLSDGKTFVVWKDYGGSFQNKSQLAFAILDISYNRVIGPTALDNPMAPTGNDNVSVTRDNIGDAIITWQDGDYSSRSNLYYAAVNGAGAIVTHPMVIDSAATPGDVIETSYDGYGNTSYSLSPTTPNVDLYIQTPSLTMVIAGSNAAVSIYFGNRGISLAGNVTMSVTLDPYLSLISANPAPSSQSGQTYTWNLADLSYLSNGLVQLTLGTLSSDAVGTKLPFNVSITSSGTEANPTDNEAIGNVMSSIQIFLPAVSTGE